MNPIIPIIFGLGLFVCLICLVIVYTYKETKPKENRKYFLRFGDLPENGKSSIYQHQEKIGEEIGVSVFECTQDTYQLILPEVLTKDLMSDVQGFFNYFGRPLYLVSGIQIGIGHDNEPIIKDAKIIKEIPYNV